MEIETHRKGGAGSFPLAWAPLLVGGLNCYGGVAFNYGFALYFLNYNHGFVKRGLEGELLAGVGFLSQSSLLAIEYTYLAAVFGVTYLVFRRMLFGTEAERRLAAALLCAPAVLPHLGIMFEQPDVTLYILLLACFALFVRSTPWVAAVASCVLCCIALLAHEAFSLMFYPLIAAILLHLCERRRLPWLVGPAHVAVVAAAFMAVLHWGSLKISADAMLLEAQSRTNVGIQRQVYDVMASNYGQQRALVHNLYNAGIFRVLALTLVISAPYLGLLGWLLNGTMRAAGYGWVRRARTGVLFALPLLLFAMGHDTTRWISAVCIDTTLFVLYLYLTEPQNSPARAYLAGWAEGPGYFPWLVYLVAIGPYDATGLRSAELLANTWFG